MGDGRSRPRKITCKWCGQVATVNSHKAEFCSEKCNQLFNKNRAKWGPRFYDLVMAGRFEREKSKGFMTYLSQLAREARDEDNKLRDGRKSWVTPERFY